jgi:class 3 adenylate cyclase
MAAGPLRKVVVVVDLSRYSDITRDLEEQFGVGAVQQLNAQIQGLVREALHAVGLGADRIPYKTTGDGAILILDTALEASNFAEALQRTAEVHNRGKSVELAQRHFRVGVWTDAIVLEERSDDRGMFLGFEMAGGAIGNAVRLEGACRTGEVLISSDTWGDLPPEHRKAYGPEELVTGKRTEAFRAHRRKVVDPAPWDAEKGGRGEDRLRKRTARPEASVDPAALLDAMGRAFSVEELAILCAEVKDDLRKAGIDLQVDLEAVGGETKPAKILNLIGYLERRGYLPHLIRAVRRARPGLV